MRSRLLTLLSLLLPVCLLPGCGSSNTPPPPPVTISVSASQPTVAVGGPAFFFATVHGTSNHAVTWQVNGGDVNGTITSGGAYTAPALVPSPALVTVTATSQADTSKSASATVTITLSVSPASATLLIQVGTQQFTAAGTNDPITWSVTCIDPLPLTCDPTTLGTISSSGLYTAPGAIPDNVLTDASLTDPNLQIIASPITVTAALQSDPTTAGSASVYVNAGGPRVNQDPQSAPVELGTSGGNINDTSGNFCCSGTLGSLVFRNLTNFILSNNHVLARSGSGVNGEVISQPGLVDTNCSPGTSVATLSQQVPLNKDSKSVADAAIAQINLGMVDTAGTVLQIGTLSNGVAQPAPPANATSLPIIGMTVAKNGRTTGLSCSTIFATDVDGVPVEYENACGSNSKFTVTYDHQIEIESSTFSAPGDSGSLIVDAQTAKPVALLFAGDDTHTVANPISTVLMALPDTANPPNFPVMVGGATHKVEACTGTAPAAGVAGESAVRVPSQAQMTRASDAKKNHFAALKADPAVIGVGIGAGDAPGEAVVVIFVDKDKTHAPIPATLDGVKTKVRSVKHFRSFEKLACPANAPIPKPIEIDKQLQKPCHSS